MWIERLASHVPPGRLSAAAVIADAGGTATEARLFTRLFGIGSVATAARGDSAEHLKSILLDALGPSPDHPPDLLIHVHAQPIAPEHRLPGQPLHGHPWTAGLRATADVDQFNCASLFYGLDLARDMLETGRARRVLLFAGDNLSTYAPRHRFMPGCSLLGDALVAMLLGPGPGGAEVKRLSTKYFPGFRNGLNAGPDEMHRFNQTHAAMVASGLAAIGHCCTADPFLVLDRIWNRTSPLDASLMSIGMGAFVGAPRLVA